MGTKNQTYVCTSVPAVTRFCAEIQIICWDSVGRLFLYLLGQCGEAILIFVGTVWRGYSYICWDSVARLFLYLLGQCGKAILIFSQTVYWRIPEHKRR